MNNTYVFVKYQRNSRTCHSMLRESIVYESSQGEETECPVCAGKEELFCRGMSEPNNQFPLTCSPLLHFFSRPLSAIKSHMRMRMRITRIRRCLVMGLYSIHSLGNIINETLLILLFFCVIDLYYYIYLNIGYIGFK